jgi:tripartite-type tricarboxylate transporter receptor subunit TctC
MSNMMSRPGRRELLGLLAAGATAGIALPAWAQTRDDYPNKTIRLVVPYPPGGATDVIGRIMAQKLSVSLGQQVVVDNRAGATGNIGASLVAKSPADGYTLLMGALTSHSINAALYGAAVPYDLEKDFAPVAIVGTVPLVFVVTNSVKAETLSQLIALAKASPGAISYASSGNGSPQHLAGEMFSRLAGVQLLHVPYKGSGPAMTDLIGGQVMMMIETAPAAQPHIQGGKLRALATATTAPIPTLPKVPTAPQAGLPGFDVASMFGILAPAGTPRPVIQKLSTALKQILSQADTREGMLTQGAVAVGSTPEEAQQAIKAEVAKWRKVIVEGNIKGE